MEPTQEQKTPTTNAQQPKRAFGDTGLFNVLSGAVAITSGVLGAWHSAARNFNNRTLNKMGIVADLQSKRDKALEVIGDGVLASKGISPNKPFKAMLPQPERAPKDIVGETQKIWNEYHEVKNTRLKEVGIDSWYKKWNLLDKYGKAEAIVVAGAAASVAIGAMITFGGLSRQSAKQEELQDRLDALDAQHR